ncbi:MAG: hypothetical protein H6706_21910 [Myxococcales bacterium]|nr:hypothetical protein [Myxococcales bacterium]
MRTLALGLIALTLAACGGEEVSSNANALVSLPPARLADRVRLLRTPRLDLDLATRCGVARVPVLDRVEASRTELASQIAVEIHGRACGAPIDGFGFDLLDEEGRDISGRSWPEVDAVEVGDDGRFVLRGRAAGCGDYTGGRTLVVQVAGVSAAVEIPAL